MKKIMCMILALVMVMGLSVTAMAVDPVISVLLVVWEGPPCPCRLRSACSCCLAFPHSWCPL